MSIKNNKIILLVKFLLIVISCRDESMLVFPFKIIGITALNDFGEEKNNDIYDSLKFCN